jgi:hypothetical protein
MITFVITVTVSWELSSVYWKIQNFFSVNLPGLFHVTFSSEIVLKHAKLKNEFSFDPVFRIIFPL